MPPEFTLTDGACAARVLLHSEAALQADRTARISAVGLANTLSPSAGRMIRRPFDIPISFTLTDGASAARVHTYQRRKCRESSHSPTAQVPPEFTLTRTAQVPPEFTLTDGASAARVLFHSEAALRESPHSDLRTH